MNQTVKDIFCNRRVKTAAVALPLIVLFLSLAPKWLFFVLLLAVLALLGRESRPLFFAESEVLRRYGAIWFLALLILSAAALGGVAALAAALVFSVFVLVLLLFADGLEPGALPRLAQALLFIIYLPFFFAHLLLVWDLPAGRCLVAMVFMVTWGGDAFSYYAGTYWGKHKLAPQISPNKTVEGLFAGLVGGAFFALLLNWLGLLTMPWHKIVILGMAANLIGQMGDLFESYLKRSHGIKDSGNLIPGHGGFLDRVDSVLFAAPVVYYGCTLWVL
ncbi:MAG: phosphatidate cytidylyltransferase [Deltaproteobacteria bacterium]|nr:phosphatidate cytidylyltransferase [Deltaproteobacteria bacterium]